jgi:hypothetical protein
MTTTRRPSSGSHANDADELRADIAEARSELGDTVQALAAKADVKKQAKDAAETAKARVAEAAGVARTKVSVAADTAQMKLAEKAPGLVQAAETAKAKATVLSERAQADPRVRRALAEARQRRVPIAAVAAAIVLVVLAVRRRRNK